VAGPALLMACAALALVAVLVSVAWPVPAGAHTDLDRTEPADLSEQPNSVAEVRFFFATDTVGSDAGFAAIDDLGEGRGASTWEPLDGRTWVARFDPPLIGDPVGVRYSVLAVDGHRIEGGISFRARPPVLTTTVAAVDSAPSEPPAAGPDRQAVDDFLAGSDASSAGGGTLALAARMVAFLGALVGVGAVAFSAWVLGRTRSRRGDRADVRAVCFWVRRGGAALVAGTLVQVVGQGAVVASGRWGEVFGGSAIGRALDGSFGIAVALRLLGGAGLLATDVPGPLRNGPAQRTGAARTLAPLAGSVLVVASFAFTGHTVSKGWRPLSALSDLVHVGAAAIWVGGVAMLAVVLRARMRSGRSRRAAELGAQFSAVATRALAAVAAAGLVLAVSVLDSPGDLVGTAWGRWLLAKLTLVAVAVGLGAYNGRVLVPALGARHADDETEDRFALVVTVEVGALLGVAILSAALVGASTL